MLSEANLPGYVASGWTCTGTTLSGGNTINLAGGDEVICSIVNNDAGVNLEMQKTVNDTSPNIGDVLTFTLEISNSGPDTATNLSVTDIVPAGFSYLPASIAGGSSTDDSSPAGSGLQWSIASLAAGASISLTFQATVLAP